MSDSHALTVDAAGDGRPALIIHGGGGPMTIAAIVGHLDKTMQTITPTLPGWNGTERPNDIQSIPDLAALLLQELEERDLGDVLVIGSSIGGWIGAEMAIRSSEGRITGLILIDAMGIEVPGETITDFFALDARGVAEHSFHDAESSTSIPRAGPRRAGRHAGQRGRAACGRRGSIYARPWTS
jgi:pimeloyl-ACP methyl ester carboxylesterase